MSDSPHLDAAVPATPGVSAARRRPWLWALIAVLVAGGVATVAWERWTATHAVPLAGAVLNPPLPAYDFRLPDQNGRLVSLSSFRGKVVALTFLYTHCPDVCPLIAEQMRGVHEQLGDTAPHVAFLAVSVDPSGDTQPAIQEFLRQHRVDGMLTYLHGTYTQLRPVWTHYFVTSDAAGSTSAARSSPAVTQVGHSAIVYVIDPRGKVQVFLPGNFDPKDLIADIRALAGRTTR
jgi:protein SCO1/2